MEKEYLLEELLPGKSFQDKVRSEDSRVFDRKPGLFRVYVYDSCTSSLDRAWELIRQDRMNFGDSVICFSQSRGRGRMGREWVSCKGNIMAAWMIPCPDDHGVNRNLISLIMGLTIKRAMLNLGVVLSLKWPNDLIYGDKKAGGILIEERNNILVAGIGINLASCPEGSRMREQSQTEPGSLDGCLTNGNQAELWARLVYFAHFCYEDTLCNFSLIDFIHEINSNLWMMGKSISVESGGHLIEGILTGVGEKGEILVEQPGGIVSIASGSIRKNQDW